jgi:hypothetical protein
MTTTHTAFTFIGGDDWEIHATLIDENDNPYDLTNAEIRWTLRDSAGNQVIHDGQYSIGIIDAVGGICSILIQSPTTTTITGGRYNDALRIITGGVTSTLSIGPVQVLTDPWRASEPATQVVSFRARRAA